MLSRGVRSVEGTASSGSQQPSQAGLVHRALDAGSPTKRPEGPVRCSVRIAMGVGTHRPRHVRSESRSANTSFGVSACGCLQI